MVLHVIERTHHLSSVRFLPLQAPLHQPFHKGWRCSAVACLAKNLFIEVIYHGCAVVTLTRPFARPTLLARSLVPSLAVTVVGLLLNIFVAHPQCLCPRGVTAIRLATCKYIYIYLVARPQSRAFLIGRDRCWVASQTW